MSSLMDFDITSTLAKYDAKDKPKPGGGSGGANTAQAAPAQPLSRAEEIVDNTAGNAGLEHELREAAQRPADEYAERMEQIRDLFDTREKAKPQPEKEPEMPELRTRVIAAAQGCLILNNVQKLIAIRNRAALQRCMGKDAETVLKKASKGQVSTVTISTALLNHIRSQIGSLSSYTNQNDIVMGFLYWYFGQPDDVVFGSEASYEKIREIVDKLRVNASPAKASELSLNATAALREQLISINETLDKMVRLMRSVAMDSIGIKVRSDKAFIGIAYLIMNTLMRTEPVSRHQDLDDVDYLAGGSAWALEAGITAAYEYFRDTNGREIYKARHGIKPRPAPPVPTYTPEPAYEPEDTGGPYGGDDDGDYEDIPMDFDPLNDDFDDMGVGSSFGPAGSDDPNYDDGIAAIDKTGRIGMQLRRDRARIVMAADKMDVDETTDD